MTRPGSDTTMGMSSTTPGSVTTPSAAGEALAARPTAGGWGERLAQDARTVRVLVKRDLTRFFRERSRVAGALLQPLIFWWVIGSGLSPSFRLPEATDVAYLAYFFPGVLVMVVLFTAIFATMSVIDDRHSGFLQAVLVAPGSRAAVVLGKALGSSCVAWVQGGLFLLLAPLAGYDLTAADVPTMVAALGLTALAFTSAGFAVAWWLDSTQGYHVVMSLLMLPLWIVSGAMFPVAADSWLVWIAKLNPMSYCVDAMRYALHGGTPPAGVMAAGQPIGITLTVVLLFALACVAWGIRVCYKRR